MSAGRPAGHCHTLANDWIRSINRFADSSKAVRGDSKEEIRVKSIAFSLVEAAQRMATLEGRHFYCLLSCCLPACPPCLGQLHFFVARGLLFLFVLAAPLALRVATLVANIGALPSLLLDSTAKIRPSEVPSIGIAQNLPASVVDARCQN